MRLALAVTAVAALLMAGCLSGTHPDQVGSAGPGGPVVPDKPDFDFSTVVDPDHAAHELASLHTAGHGLDLAGQAPIQQILPTGVRGSITSIDIAGNYAVVSGMEGGLAFAIVDLTDREHPKAVGWAPTAADGWTARFSDDGNYVFYGCQMLGAEGQPSSTVVGTCTDPNKPHPPQPPVTTGTPLDGNNPAGISVWNVTDKAHPKFVTFTASGGSHNIYVAEIGGSDYVFTASTSILKFDRAAKTLTVVAELPGTHDVTVARHPVTHDWLLFTGTGELAVYNVNDPADPQPVFEGNGKEGWTGWHDQVLVPGLVAGKAILLLSGESFAGTGAEALPDVVSVLDVTDISKPTMLGQWQAPFKPKAPWAGYLYSVHEMAATPTGQVAIAWYHGGVWVIDVSTADRQAGPVTLAAYQPHADINVLPSTFAQTPLPYVPFVWGAGWTSDGYLVVPDMHTGVYVLKPDWGLHAAADSGQ